MEVHQVMVAKNIQLTGMTFNLDSGFPFADSMFGNTIRMVGNVLTLIGSNQLGKHLVLFVINKMSAAFYLLYKDAELVQVIFECWENVNMVPGYTRQDRDVRKKKMELWSFFQCACRIFITLTYDQWGICYLN